MSDPTEKKIYLQVSDLEPERWRILAELAINPFAEKNAKARRYHEERDSVRRQLRAANLTFLVDVRSLMIRSDAVLPLLGYCLENGIGIELEGDYTSFLLVLTSVLKNENHLETDAIAESVKSLFPFTMFVVNKQRQDSEWRRSTD